MSIEADAALTDLITGPGDSLAIQIQGAVDFTRAAQALRDARHALRDLPGGQGRIEVSAVVASPTGPLVVLDRVPRRAETAEAVIEAVTTAIEAVGIRSATISGLRTGGFPQLDRCPNAVILRLFPSPAGSFGVLSAEWVDLAAEWLVGDLGPDDPVHLRVLGVEFEVAVAEAAGILHQAALARAWCDAFVGDLEQRIRTASVTFGGAPHVGLGAGGPSVDSTGMLARFELLIDVAREFAATTAYACVDIEPTFEGLAGGLTSTWQDEGGARAHVVAGQLTDVAVPDVYPYQILGPGHAHRLRESDPELGDPPVGEALGDGRFEVIAGDTSDWLPVYDAREDVQAENWELLGPLLLTKDEADQLLDELDLEGREPAGPPESTDLAAGSPDLSSITIEALPHVRRGTHLTVLELAAWLAQSDHSDEPPSVSLVVGTFVRLLAQGLDDEQRQRLKPFAWRVLDTADGSTPDELGPLDRERAWLACDWLVRVQGEAWLRAAGLTEAADSLVELGPVTDNEQLLVAVDRLGAAATIASRRVEITLNIATGDPGEGGVLEQIAWDAWERASEASAWVAASEAASRGIPSELAFATDLRVIECSRDERTRDELDDRHSGLGDQAWRAALGAIAEEAWQHAWSAAEESVYESSTFSLATVIRRSMTAVALDLELDEDQVENLFGEAEAQGRAMLAAAALRGGAWENGEHPWDAARRMARASTSGGNVWGSTIDSARRAVGEMVYSDAMEAARRATDVVLHVAPDVVGRTVAAAVAREASGAAGRGLALRAAAVARAHGSDDVEAEAAADEALAGVVKGLRESAFALLDEMIELKVDDS